MCVGDSITFMGGENSYPAQLEEILNKHNTGIRFKVINKGIPGSISAITLSQLEEDLEKYKPHMVITMIGVNEYRGGFAYEDNIVSKIKIFLLEGIKVYKLAKWLYARIVNKINISESMLKRAIAINPKRSNTHIILAEHYMADQKLEESESILKKAIEISPNDKEAYVMLGHIYNKKGLYKEAEIFFQKGLGPENYNQGLGECYLNQRRYVEAEEYFKKSIEQNPMDCHSYIWLGDCLRIQRKFREAENVLSSAILNKALEKSSGYYTLYSSLGKCYMEEGGHLKAKEMFEKGLKLASKKDNAYPLLVISLREYYEEQQEKKGLKKIYNILAYNYNRIRQKILDRGIKLVSVQYPTLEINSLMGIFNLREDITFVDNENIFKDALEHGKYEDYFTDDCGGSFGHLAPKGAKLLAENIADTILEKFFNQ
jgi:tetratricopeptide (TPR) repeat protein